MATPPSPKRRKITRACDCCRAQKKRCTGTIPCDSCVRNTKKCTFLASYTRGRAITPPPSASSIHTPVTPSPSLANTFLSTTSPGRIHKTPRSPSHSAVVPAVQSPRRNSSFHPPQDKASWNALEETSDLRTAEPAQDATSEHASDEILADGNYVGPTSAHSWLRQAWSCLGRVRQHVFQLHSTQVAGGPSTRIEGPIFSHGDKALREDLVETTRIPHLSANTLELLKSTYFDRGLATYRFLHRPIVTSWLQELQSPDSVSHFPPVRTAIVLLFLATGSSYITEKERASLPKAEAELLRNEVLFYRALQKLKEERGAPSVESVQARLLQVHYLLTSSRPNRAWYAFGTVIQLVFALGLHQRSYGRSNMPGLAREMRRRIFWSVYKTDKSLSIALGRPSLMREECITQDLPEAANDEQIFPDHIDPDSDDDCLLVADILQIKLARIVGRSMREYYETDDNALVQLITSNNAKLADWRSDLPAFLSGTIKPSSLIPVLRRQATILKLFYLHTVIFINRPLLLKSFSTTSPPDSDKNNWSPTNDTQIASSIASCIDAASEIAKQAVQFNVEGQAFRAFWFSQNMTFNAVSILYLNALRLLQENSHGNSNSSSSGSNVKSSSPPHLTEEEKALVAIAEEAQRSLTNASEYNAPGQRYGIVLEQLRLEVRAQIDCAGRARVNHGMIGRDNIDLIAAVGDGGVSSGSTGLGGAGGAAGGGGIGVNGTAHGFVELNAAVNEGLEWANVTSETPLNDASMFWPQFDGLPLGFDDWLGTEFAEPMVDYGG